MTPDDVINGYFEWLSNFVCGERFSKDISYNKLLRTLHHTKFRYLHPMDENRSDDGKALRYRFALQFDDRSYIRDCLRGPCSVFEMMVALAIHCEKHIMDNPILGNRTGQWFWGMVTSLGLGSMHDDNFDRQYVEDTLETFLDRKYKPNGSGGLFTIKRCERDLRDVEIFHQMCWYINNVT